MVSTVLTWNVRWATPRSPRRHAILHRIFRHNPDIFCLTEVDSQILAGRSGHVIRSRPDGLVGQGSQRQENSRSMVDRAFGADRRSRARPYATRSVCPWRHEGSSVGRGNCHRCVHPLARLTNSLDERRNEAQDVGRSQEVLRDPEERAPACTLETPHPIGRLQPEYKRRQSAERRARGSALRVLG